MAKFRSKKVIEAIQYTWNEPSSFKQEAQDAVADFMDQNIEIVNDSIMVQTAYGEIPALPGDWICRDPDEEGGVFHVYSPDQFLTYWEEAK